MNLLIQRTPYTMICIRLFFTEVSPDSPPPFPPVHQALPNRKKVFGTIILIASDRKSIIR